MTFEEFLAYVRKNIGNYCNDSYWRWTYDHCLESKTFEAVKKATSYLAINAIATDYVSNHG